MCDVYKYKYKMAGETKQTKNGISINATYKQ